MQPLQVGRVPQQNSKRVLSVTTTSTGLLEISLRTVRYIEMYDKTDIRLIDSHSECIGTNHHPYVILLPPFLSVRTGILAQSGMIERRRDTVRRKKGSKFLRTFTTPYIHDS